MTKLSILLVDDQRLFAASLKRVLETEPDLKGEVSSADSGPSALLKLQQGSFDIVLLDVHMPEMNGIETCRRIRAEHPGVKILMLSAFAYDDFVQEALDAGANGYLLKDCTPDRLIEALRGVLAGNIILAPPVMRSLAGKMKRSIPEPQWLHELTPREREILKLIAEGRSNGEIGAVLNLGSQTVYNYVSSIYSKIGAKDRFEAMRISIETGLIEHND